MLEKDGRKGFLLEHASFFGNEATHRAAGAASHIIATEAESWACLKKSFLMDC